MFRHVALWKFDDDSDPGRDRECAITVKAGLEELAYEVHGIVSVDVHIDPARTPTGNADLFLEAEFEDRDAFRDYLDHPRRKAVLALLAERAEERLCMEFEEEETELL